MVDNEVKPSSIPHQTYSMKQRLDQYFLDMLGVITGHGGFDNNFLMMKTLMNITLPQILSAKENNLLDNGMKKTSSIKLNKIYLQRINQIWWEGFHCINYREQQPPYNVIYRMVAYKHADYSTGIKIQEHNYDKPWEVMAKCFKCKNDIKKELKPQLVGFMEDQEFNVSQTRCEILCPECGFDEIVSEVEVKPPLNKMIPLLPRSQSPIWTKVSAQIPIKFGLNGIDLVSLFSNDGGFYFDNSISKYPRFENAEDILESIHTTDCPSHIYYDDTTDRGFDEWLFYYNKILPLLHAIVTEKYLPHVLTGEKTKRIRMEEA